MENKTEPGLNNFTIAGLVIVVIVLVAVVVYGSQLVVEQGALPDSSTADTSTLKERHEVSKLSAEIRQIRSDTGGSLFWMKMIAVFVTVGGAVGGYLVGHSRATRARIASEERRNTERIEFENRQNIDIAYQSIVQELSAEASLLRAAAVKLGGILQSFPAEWNVSPYRREQLIHLTKQVLAAALAIEEDEKVLKALTIALVLHHPWHDDPNQRDEKGQYGDVRRIDLSRVKAEDAYWARVDFSEADFYKAVLVRASLRLAILHYAQFRETALNEAVLVNANCTETNFKLADLRGADLTRSNLVKANFEGAKVYGAILTDARVGNNPEGQVDDSRQADGSQMVSIQEWLAKGSQGEASTVEL
jgi:hypothetical protein